MYQETTPFNVFICNKKRVHEMFLKFKREIFWLKTSITILESTKYFLVSSALQTLVPPNLYLLLSLSRILNMFNASFCSSLNRLDKSLSKICTNRRCIEPAFCLYLAKLFSKDKPCTKHN